MMLWKRETLMGGIGDRDPYVAFAIGVSNCGHGGKGWVNGIQEDGGVGKRSFELIVPTL